MGMRIPRPYDTEDEFIQGDGLAIGRQSMILIGAPPRSPGIVVRFELLKRNGQPLFRGEGKVVAHRVHANGRQGLEVRFTRLDTHSKDLVDRVLKMRKSGALAPASSRTEDLSAHAAEAPSEDQDDDSIAVRDSLVPLQAALSRTHDDDDLPASVPHVTTYDATVADASEPEPDASDEAEPEATVFDGVSVASRPSVAEDDDDGVMASEPPLEDDDGVMASEPPLEDDATACAPPVSMFANVAEPPPVPMQIPDVPAVVRVPSLLPEALDRLRSRTALFDIPSGAGSALDRLRARLHP